MPMPDWLFPILDSAARLGADALLITSPVHMFYLAGIQLSGTRPAAFLLDPSHAEFVGCEEDGEAAHQAAPWLTHRSDFPYHPRMGAGALLEGFERALAGALHRWSAISCWGIEAGHLPWAAGRVLGPALTVDVTEALLRARLRKRPDEIARIADAVACNDAAFQAVAGALQPGVSELELLGQAFAGMCRAAPEAPFLNLAVSDAVSGPRTWEIGGPATTRRLQPGDIFLLDISTRCQGYFADTTRCFILGDPSAELQRMHRTLEEAVQAGQDAIRPGLRAGELDAIVRGVVHAAGYAPAHFPHHVGHGIGLAPQEDPWIVSDSDQVLKEGMVFTLEPGIYIPGVGGMRLEDNFVVTAGGCQALSRYPRRLTIVL